jgi:predicted nucleotidyltransferase
MCKTKDSITDKNSVLSVIARNSESLRKIGVVRIGLFGSYCRNENRKDSDVDLILEFDPIKKSFHNYMEACDLLEQVIDKRLDVVTPESISPNIKSYIDKEVIYERL